MKLDLCGRIYPENKEISVVEIKKHPVKTDLYRRYRSELKSIGSLILKKAKKIGELLANDTSDLELCDYVTMVQNSARLIDKIEYEKLSPTEYDKIYAYYTDILADLGDTLDEVEKERIAKSFTYADCDLDTIIRNAGKDAEMANKKQIFDTISTASSTSPSSSGGLAEAFSEFAKVQKQEGKEDQKEESKKDKTDDDDDDNGE